MPIAEFCRTDVVVLEKNSSVVEAAKAMREAHVGDVVVCENQGGQLKPIGILTDRDIVVGLIALGIPVETIRVEDLMTPTLVMVSRQHGVYETIQMMETYGVRRLPVVDEAGRLIGIVSSGDLMELLGREILSLARLPAKQKAKEQEMRQ